MTVNVCVFVRVRVRVRVRVGHLYPADAPQEPTNGALMFTAWTGGGSQLTNQKARNEAHA